MFGHRFAHHIRRTSSRWSGHRWIRRGVLLLILPIGAVACHARPHHHGNISEAEAKERAAEHIDDAMDWIDGTEAQKQQVKQVVDGAIPDMMSFRDEHRALRTEFQKELAAPTVSPTALEDLRVRFMRLADAASQRAVKALGDVAQVLTLEQRQKIIEKWRKFSS